MVPRTTYRPTARGRASAAAVPSEHQRVGIDERVRVARAGRPPRGVGIEEGVNTRLGVIGVAEVLNPGYSGAG